MSRVRYLCFPGLGQNGDIAWPQRSLPFDVVGVDPIEPIAGETLASHARRLARRLRAQGLLEDPSRTLLAGVSYGSALAQEIAAVEPCAGVLILSGLRNAGELARPLRYAAHRAYHAPGWTEVLVDRSAAFVLRRFANVTRRDAERCAAMIRNLPFVWTLEQARMIADWRGCRYEAPTLRVHGDRDAVVPSARAHGVDVVLEGDRHLSSVARADEVNRAIERFAQRLFGTDTAGARSVRAPA
jgi:pimeloyl-ACP methyl ester carboxylesterase